MFFKNTEPNKHTYKLEVVGKYAGKIEIKRFKQTTVKAGQGKKEVLILSTTENLSTQKNTDSVLLVKLKSYSTTEPERVVVHKELSFIYPSTEKVK